MTRSKATEPLFVTAGKIERELDVLISYRIIELFSEGLYSSANKAFEELVTNSFDAGARKSIVLLPPDPGAPGATIAVCDDGEGMNALGLEQLWQIGVSQKRSFKEPPHGRAQIGKFGIGKLATYVLANRLTYICKTKKKYFATTMDFSEIDKSTASGIAPTKPISLKLRNLTAVEAKKCLQPWIATKNFQDSHLTLFGNKASPSWTVAVLSSLKEKAKEIQPGRLRWVLETALPLRDDFAIYFNGVKLVPSKAGKGRIGKWVLGKDITELKKPAPPGLSIRKDRDAAALEDRFGLYHKDLGRVTGYAEAYRDVLTTGKSKELGRSYGFFVYVFGRLINIDDEYFGVDSNKLKHGTFARFRFVVHIDKLDDELRSTRETVRDGPLSSSVRNLLHAVFNYVRPKIEQHDEAETLGARISRKVAGSPASLSRRPLIDLARAALDGSVDPRYMRVPRISSLAERDAFIERLEARAEQPDDFIDDVSVSYDLGAADGIAVFEAATHVLRINGLHPFVGAFSDDFQSRKRSFPLELFAFAEVLLEAQLHHLGHKTTGIDEIMKERDELLRFLAKTSGRRTALMVAQDLQDARNDKNQLEVELVAAFDKLGFEASRI